MAATLIVSSGASANPIVTPSQNFFDETWLGLTYLFLANLPLDILLLSTSVLITFRYFGLRAGKLREGADRFVWIMIAASVLVAAMGAVIDSFLLFKRISTEDGRVSIDFYAYDFSLVEGLVAAVLVALSIYAVSVLMLRMDKVFAALPAVAIGAVNFIAWSQATDGYGIFLDPGSIGYIIFIAYALVPIPLILMRAWHRSKVIA